VVAEGKDFIVREAVIMKDEITEIITFVPKQKVSFHGHSALRADL
jgi:REP element-mobilizing transposase RayT